MVARAAELQQMLEPAVAALGFELWGLDYSTGGKRKLLRIYIDGPNGVNIDDCAAVSRQVSSVLDVEDPIAGEFTLEVSSPGVDRPLYKLEHYQRYAGHQIKLRLRFPFEGQRNFSGLLNGIENDEVLLVIGEDELLLPFEQIEKGQIVGELQSKGRK